MKTRILLFIFAGLLTYGCKASSKPYTVFNYDDFGPQAMAWKTIGMQWWQWDNHGDSDPKSKCDIKVVVYTDMSLDEIKLLFPINRTKKKDFRYLQYNDSLKYLENNIQEMEIINEQWAVDLKEHLKNTKERILREIRTRN